MQVIISNNNIDLPGLENRVFIFNVISRINLDIISS